MYMMCMHMIYIRVYKDVLHPKAISFGFQSYIYPLYVYTLNILFCKLKLEFSYKSFPIYICI